MGINLRNYGWDKVKASEPGNFAKLPAGGYVCKIYDARCDTVKGKGYRLTCDIDIAEGEHAGFFAKRNSTERGWDFNAQFKRYLIDAATRQPPSNAGNLKKFFELLEEANPNFHFDIDNFEPQKLRDLVIGFTFGEREYLDKKNNVRLSTTIRFYESVEKIRSGDFTIPPVEKLSDDQKTPEVSADEFAGTPVSSDDIPFDI